jgi:hypothetical protein
MRQGATSRVEPDPQFWSEPSTLDALRARDFGRLFRLLTIACGASQTRIGIDTDLSQGQVSQIIHGTRRISQMDVIERVADGLRMPDHARLALGLAPTKDGDGVHRRDFLKAGLYTGAAVAGAVTERAELLPASALRPDHSTAGHLAALVHALRHEDDQAPTGSLLGVSRHLLRLAEQWTTEARMADQRDIGRAAAEAAVLHWWLTVDAGLPADIAGDHAIGLATEWEHPALIGHMFGWRSGQAIAGGRLHEAIRLARQARQPRWGLSPGAVGWSSNYEARAQALLGDTDGLALALDDGQTANENIDLAGEPPWLYWLGDKLELDQLDLRLLREGPDAIADLDAVLAAYPIEHARDVAWYRAHTAAARARAGDIEGAAVDAADAARLSSSTGTNWTMNELRQISAAPHLRRVREALTDSSAS